MPAARFLRVRGVVQGVGFRPFVYRLARGPRDHGLGAQRRRRRRDPCRRGGGGAGRFRAGLRRSRRRRPASPPSRSRPSPPAGCARLRDPRQRGRRARRPSASPRTCRSARPASRSCSTPPTGATATPTSTAPTAARATASSSASPTIAREPRCGTGRSAPDCAARVSRSARPSLPCPAGGLPGLRAAGYLLRRTTRERGDLAARRGCCGKAGSWRSRGSAATTWPSMPRNAAAVAALARAQVPQGEALRGYGEGSRDGPCPGRPLPRRRGAAHSPPRARSCWRRAGSICRASRRTTSTSACMLPYTPVHHLLFAAGAPEVLVMTSANRSSEPLAYRGRRRASSRWRGSPMPS